MTLEQVKSSLQMTKLYVEKFSFSRGADDIGGRELEIEFKRGKQKIGESVYKITLGTVIMCENGDFSLEISVAGIFDVSNVSAEQREEMLNKNTFAIIFPFVRAQVTLMTSQPGMQPVVLPALNINAMLEHSTEIAED